jgi:hypothetical protein
VVRGDEKRATEPVGDLEHDRDLRFQRREWTIQRGGWLVMMAIMAAALIGLLGAGPLSSATAESGPLQLQYTRFERRHAPTALEVSVARSAANQDQVDVWVSADYLARVEISSIVPEPEEVMVADDHVIYRFNIDDQAHSPTIHIALEPDDPGHIIGRIGMIDGPELIFWQFIYP